MPALPNPAGTIQAATIIVALPLSALVAFVAMTAIIAALSILGIDDQAISTTLSTLVLVAIPVLTFVAVVWVYRRIPKRMRASLEESEDQPAKVAARSRDEMWREVSELDARFAAPHPPPDP